MRLNQERVCQVSVQCGAAERTTIPRCGLDHSWPTWSPVIGRQRPASTHNQGSLVAAGSNHGTSRDRVLDALSPPLQRAGASCVGGNGSRGGETVDSAALHKHPVEQSSDLSALSRPRQRPKGFLLHEIPQTLALPPFPFPTSNADEGARTWSVAESTFSFCPRRRNAGKCRPGNLKDETNPLLTDSTSRRKERCPSPSFPPSPARQYFRIIFSSPLFDRPSVLISLPGFGKHDLRLQRRWGGRCTV